MAKDVSPHDVLLGRTSVGIAAMAAVDMALWDLKGKHYGEPIHRLLGGKHHCKIKAYASILFGHGQGDFRHRSSLCEAGYQAIKCGWEPMGQNEALDIDLVRGAREGIGDGTLLIDAGCVWDARTALRRAHAFSRSSTSNGSKSRSARTIWKATFGSAIAPPCRLPRAKESAAARHFALGSTPGARRLSGRPVALRVYRCRIHPCQGGGKTAPGFAIIVTRAR